MTFKPTVWYPIAAELGVLNLVSVAFAVGPVPPWHATIHATLAVAFGVWAQRLRQRRLENEREAQLAAPEAVEELESEVDLLRQELAEMQERVDFAERMLAQRSDVRPIDPPRS